MPSTPLRHSTQSTGEVDLPRFSGQVDYAASAFTRMTASYFIGLFPASAV